MHGNVTATDGGVTSSRPKKKEKAKFSISLSAASAQAFLEIKEWTDADTDSEVFRNALRLQKTLLKAHRDGKRFLIQDSETGKSEVVQLFAEIN